jgi:transposase InsO family protein
MNKYEERKQAIQRYKAGEKVTHIAKEFGKSRQWFYNWLARYEEADGGDGWYESRSRAPLSTPNKVSSELEEQVVATRRKLEKKGVAQIGAIAISYELCHQGIEPPPVWTINRIIARHGLNKSKPAPRSKKDYPQLFFHTHQMDLVGPRWLKDKTRFYSVNMIDTMSRSCSVTLRKTKQSGGIAGALATFWASHGMPDALQMDNELAFRGSNRYPRSFGVVVRLALALGIAPVFIPVKEPWRNGIIERFNRTWDERFFRSQTFRDFNHLTKAAGEFVDFHNSHHRYSALGQKTPDQRKAELLSTARYDGHINLDKRIPLEEGSIYFVRFIRSDGKLHLHTESFKVPESLKYSYVVAEISVENHCMFIQQDNQIVQTLEYIMPVDW